MKQLFRKLFGCAFGHKWSRGEVRDIATFRRMTRVHHAGAIQIPEADWMTITSQQCTHCRKRRAKLGMCE